MQLNHLWETVGVLSAVVIWGTMLAILMLPRLKRRLAVLSSQSKRSPFRVALGAIALGIAIAYGGTKPSPKVVELPPPTANTSLVYTGAEQQGVSYDSRLICKDGQAAATNAGDYSATFALPVDTEAEVYKWKDGETGDKSVDWSVGARNVNDATVTFDSIRSQFYTGNPITPPVTMKFAGLSCVTGTDYSVAYSNNVDVGTAAVTVTGVGNFTGEKSLYFRIAKGDDEIVPTGVYLARDLVDDFGIEIPTNVNYAAGDKVTVKVEGLPKGLKLVATQQKDTTGKKAVTNVIYTIEGVPTETIDFESQTMYARVTTTYKDKSKTDDGTGKAESLQPIALTIEVPEPHVLTAGVLNQVYEPVDIATLWPEVAGATNAATAKEWSFKGWPAGIKYNNKATAANWSYKTNGVSVKTTAAAYAVYGIPTKAGEYPITATHKYKPDGGKTTVSETYSATLTVWGDDGASDFRYVSQAYVAVSTNLDNEVTAASGLPSGLKFDKAYRIVAGTPTKPGVFAVTLTKTDKSKETFLWKVTPGENDGFLGTMDWTVTNSTVTVMSGVIQTNWTCNLPADAKVSASGLPAGLKLVQDKATGEWTLSGTPTKAGNYTVTFKTVRNGVTVVERVAIVVTENKWAGSWYGLQIDIGNKETLAAEVTVAANGTVKLVFTEASTNYNAKGAVQSAVKKTTVSVKNLDANGKTATLTLPKDKKDTTSVDRRCVLDFDEATLTVDGEPRMLLGEADTSVVWRDVTTVVLEETSDGATNAYGYVTATYKKGKFTFAGKLWDGTAVKGTAYALADGSVSPVLVTDKAKNAVSITLGTADEVLLVFVRENGELVTIGRKVMNGYVPLSGSFSSDYLSPSRKFNVITDADSLVVLNGPDGGDSVATQTLAIPAKSLATAVSAQGLVKFTITDEYGWKWVSELLLIDNGGALQFRGIATGTKKGEQTQVCPVWAVKSCE